MSSTVVESLVKTVGFFICTSLDSLLFVVSSGSGSSIAFEKSIADEAGFFWVRPAITDLRYML